MKEADFTRQRAELVLRLVRQGILRSQSVIDAFLKVPREFFVWPSTRESSYMDAPLPLGETGQTISAPHMVAIMLEVLELYPGQSVLEIGAGSGYNASLMAEIAGPEGSGTKGKVVTIDRVPELVEFAGANIAKAGYADRVVVVSGDGTLGYPEGHEGELYDRIIVTAAAPRIPRQLERQLKVGGIILLPIGDLAAQTLMKGVKKADRRIEMDDICGCLFVPLIGQNGFRSQRTREQGVHTP